MGFIWNLLVAGGVILLVSHFMKGVRCKSYLDAVITAFVYTVLWFVFMKVAAPLGVLAWLAATVVTFGLAAVSAPLVAMVTAFLVSWISLYVADKLVDGFEIESVGTTALAAFLIGLCNFVMASLGLMV